MIDTDTNNLGRWRTLIEFGKQALKGVKAAEIETM